MNSSLHEVGFELSVLHQLALDEIGSPSHSIRVKQGSGEPARVALAPEKDVPSRDLVLDVRFKENKTQVLAGAAGDGKRSFAIIVPSAVFGSSAERPRRTVILLDRSGSMQGEPIAQARKAIEACLAALSDQDAFVLLAFDDRVEAMHSELVPATGEQRESARAFLKRVDARGASRFHNTFPVLRSRQIVKSLPPLSITFDPTSPRVPPSTAVRKMRFPAITGDEWPGGSSAFHATFFDGPK